MSSPEFQRNSENYCYRHPDRVSFVLCQRCLRTVCSECQTPAAVGVVCPECMQQQKTQRTPAQKKAERRWRGGRVLAGSGRVPATNVIVLVTVAAWLLQQIPTVGPAITSALAFNSLFTGPAMAGFEPWRMVTVLLTHSGILHLGLNMLSLWMLGRVLEPLLGWWRFLALYLVAGLGGSAAVALLAPGTWVVGASGAVFGLLGAIVVIGRSLGGNITGILIILGINLVYGFIQSASISWQGHVGGLVFGLAAGAVFAYTRRPNQRGVQIGLIAALAVLALVLAFAIAPLVVLA